MKDEFNKGWIIENAVKICSNYSKGVLTLRGLHYQLVGIGMTNDMRHYKRVVSAITDARWDRLIDFDTFSDLDRTMIGSTEYKDTILKEEINKGKENIKGWMNFYKKNIWENQEFYPEILIEKKALQGVFRSVCNKWKIALGACKGYPSLTFLRDLSIRLMKAKSDSKEPLVIYFGDYDPSGEDIPRSIRENIKRLGIDVDVKRIALMKEQVEEWNLPQAPTKLTDTRTKNWSGIGQVELDAVKPEKIIEMCEKAIIEVFDFEKFDELQETEKNEKLVYKSQMKKFVNELKD